MVGYPLESNKTYANFLLYKFDEHLLRYDLKTTP
jgi:hypothetical protein